MRAALAGESLSELLLAEVELFAALPFLRKCANGCVPEVDEADRIGRRPSAQGTGLGMIVVDASAMVELLLDTDLGSRIDAKVMATESRSNTGAHYLTCIRGATTMLLPDSVTLNSQIEGTYVKAVYRMRYSPQGSQMSRSSGL